MELIDKAQRFVAQTTTSRLTQFCHCLTGDEDLTGCRCIETAQQVQQGAFSRARGTDNGDTFSLGHREVYPFQHFDRNRSLLETLAQSTAGEDHPGFHGLLLIHSEVTPPAGFVRHAMPDKGWQPH